MKLLLVEDNIDYAKLLIHTLESKGYEVVHRTTGWDSMKTACNEYFHAILLDFGLPDITGVDLYKMLRPMLPTIPIVMLTAYTNKFSAEDAKGLGFDGYLPKPVDIPAFLDMVKRLTTQTVEHEPLLDRLASLMPNLIPLLGLQKVTDIKK